MLRRLRRHVDDRPTYGYRRITALLRRELAAEGLPLVNHKKVYRLMRMHGLLLARHSGQRPGRTHDGKVIVMASNRRWCSDALEFTCWNGEIVRVAFVIDAHDREVIAWRAVVGSGISGSEVRDMMLEAVEKRFGAIRAPHAVEWLSDNGSPYTAHETRVFAGQLNLTPCFTPVASWAPALTSVQKIPPQRYQQVNHRFFGKNRVNTGVQLELTLEEEEIARVSIPEQEGAIYRWNMGPLFWLTDLPRDFSSTSD